MLHVVELIHEINALEAVQVAVGLLRVDYRLLPPHLGRTDASIVLRSVNLWFSSFSLNNAQASLALYSLVRRFVVSSA